MKIALVLSAIFLLSACVEQQRPRGPGQTIPGTSFHPTLYVSPGTSGGVSKSTYTITELNR